MLAFYTELPQNTKPYENISFSDGEINSLKLLKNKTSKRRYK